MSERKERDFSVDLLRGLGILLMIFGHIRPSQSFDLWIHGFHMPLFFLVSGYMFADENTAPVSFLKKKAAKLLLPFFGFALLNFLYCFCFIPADRTDILWKFFRFLLRPNQNRVSVGTAVWFLPALFWTQVFFFAAVKAAKNRPVLLFAFSLGTGLIGALLPRFEIFLPAVLSHGLVGTAFCGTGYALRTLSEKYRTKKNHRDTRLPVRFLLSAAGLFLFAFLIRKNQMVNFRTEAYRNLLLTWLNAVGTTVSLFGIMKGIEELSARKAPLKAFFLPLSRIGADSLIYLCLNQMIIHILRNRIFLYHGQPLRLYNTLIGLSTAAVCYGIVLLKNRFPKPAVRRRILAAALLLIVFLSAAAYRGRSARIIDMMNQNLRYGLQTWWNAPKPEAFQRSSNTKDSKELTPEQEELMKKSRDSFLHWREQEVLLLNQNEDIERAEQGIRPLGHLCYMLSSALRFGYYDEKTVGIPSEEAKQMLFLLMRSAAVMHQDRKWGHTWQSALWAENIGFGAYLLWDEMQPSDRDLLQEMILDEAGYILKNYEIPYYMDKNGTVLYEGDTKGEEIAWDTKILALAACMFPDHPDAALWEKKLSQMLIASAAAPSSLADRSEWDGIVPAEFLEGSNINEDGTVINHNRCHIDYMTTIVQEMADTEVIYRIAGRKSPLAAVYNIDKIYSALVCVDLGDYDSEKKNHHFYERASSGFPGPELSMPGETDWGGKWYGSCYLTDTYADEMGLDHDLPEDLRAARWKAQHFDRLEQMMKRNPDGNFFKKGENQFISGEFFQMHNVTKAYLLKTLKPQQ